jgi:hypothetical protein
MAAAQTALAQLLNSPNACTVALAQIKRSDMILTNQLNNLRQAQAEASKLESQYNKLLDSNNNNSSLSSPAMDGKLQRVQPLAEQLDRQLRVLEKTVAILEENKQYK